MQRLIFILIITFGFISCKNSEEKENNQKSDTLEITNTNTKITLTPEEKFISSIEKAHKKRLFKKKEAIQFDIDLNFRGNDRLDATITLVPNSTKIRIDKKDGSSLIYDGKEVYISPANANDTGARFDMFTWTYFFALPYKLSDPGTLWSELKRQTLDTIGYNTGKLTFKKNTGDAPDDWYIIYADENTNVLHAAAYIVTFGGNTIEKAAENPHAIKYTDYTKIEGIPVATRWGYYNWNIENGFGDQIGEAIISNIQFVSPRDTFFKKPDNHKIISL